MYLHVSIIRATVSTVTIKLHFFTSVVRLKDMVTFDCKFRVEQESQSVVDEMTEEATIVLLLSSKRMYKRTISKQL